MFSISIIKHPPRQGTLHTFVFEMYSRWMDLKRQSTDKEMPCHQISHSRQIGGEDSIQKSLYDLTDLAADFSHSWSTNFSHWSSQPNAHVCVTWTLCRNDLCVFVSLAESACVCLCGVGTTFVAQVNLCVLFSEAEGISPRYELHTNPHRSGPGTAETGTHTPSLTHAYIHSHWRTFVRGTRDVQPRKQNSGALNDWRFEDNCRYSVEQQPSLSLSLSLWKIC